jgi:diaminohydroxyphosphoribosylaminopyrimidine deaminase / 5-amino-6-(5-phosphoribosylamino)uracil reductase
VIGRDQAWRVVRDLAARASAGAPLLAPEMLDGIALDPAAPRGWRAGPAPADREATALLDLYVPLCVGPAASELVVAHLAQSLDGRIATASGASQFISGQEDVEHAHRMRALFDAVVVGAGTVARDDPRLTCRLVPGEHAVRVVVDPDRRLPAEHGVFQDGAAPTLLLCRRAHAAPARHGHAEVIGLDADDGAMPVAAMIAALAARGLRRLFVEGGGVTVSHFLAARALDRLHVAVAPVILGSGRPAFALPEIDQLSEAIALDCRHVSLGPDVLFDCALPRR